MSRKHLPLRVVIPELLAGLFFFFGGMLVNTTRTWNRKFKNRLGLNTSLFMTSFVYIKEACKTSRTRPSALKEHFCHLRLLFSRRIYAKTIGDWHGWISHGNEGVLPTWLL